jgi:hypothetical protein
MTVARFFHTATLLPSGQVLIAGGATNEPYESAELYDPTAGTFTATGSMTVGRWSHTATLLPSGQVLMVGGEGGLSDTLATGVSAALASAELYDPAAGTFTATGSMAMARYSHTATLLPSGMVLIAGGTGDDGDLASAELYDPATGTFTATGSMGTPRWSHTATLLLSGKALIAGGAHGGSLASAELYDPATRMFTATSSMGVARQGLTATLLPGGLVLIAGGQGVVGGKFLASAELYDPTAGAFIATGRLGVARAGHTATLLPDGEVLIVGGDAGNDCGYYCSSAELYDPSSGTFTATGRLTDTRQYFTATLLLSGQVLIAGGVDWQPENEELYE